MKILLIAVLIACLSAGAVLAKTSEEIAGGILDSTGIKGGIVVHLGCGDGRLTAALRASEAYVVHGLEADPAKVAAKLLAVSAADGKVLSETSLDSPPVFDGMIAANGRLFASLRNGTIVCLKKK